MVEPGKITIFGYEDTGVAVEHGLSLFKKSEELKVGRAAVEVAVLRDGLTNFLEGMRSVVDSIPGYLGGYRVDSVALAAEVSAKGTVSLLGTGGEIAGKGGITFTFVRRPPPSRWRRLWQLVQERRATHPLPRFAQVRQPAPIPGP